MPVSQQAFWMQKTFRWVDETAALAKRAPEIIICVSQVWDFRA
jgi:hypothetical protein